MLTADFDYSLPPELIAQTPIEPRHLSRLMLLQRRVRRMSHHRFDDIGLLLEKGDLLVFNDSRVIPARLYAKRSKTGARVEILLLKRVADNTWEAMVKPAKRLKKGAEIETESGEILGEICDVKDDGIRVIEFCKESSLLDQGTVPLPPYIHRPIRDPERYQTVYAKNPGSVAAPTSGLHFSQELLEHLSKAGIECTFVTLHIGLDTFRPVKVEDPGEHKIHTEYGVVSKETSYRIHKTKNEGRRVIAVGTSTARLLEFTHDREGFGGWVGLYILPGYEFKAIDGMVTNFHLPRSTLLMMVSALAGREFILEAYREAIKEKYRFYSFGDAMLII